MPILIVGILFYATIGFKILPHHDTVDTEDSIFDESQDFSKVPKWKKVLSLVILIVTLIGMIFEEKPNFNPNGSNADCAIILPGAPIRDRLPPIAAANTSGIKSLDLLWPDFAAIPITTGIRTAGIKIWLFSTSAPC